LVDFDGFAAFLPLSQMDPGRFLNGIPQADQVREMVGQDVTVRVKTVRRDTKSLILSEKEALLTEYMRTKLKIGDILTGRVSNIREYGAFVTLPLRDSDGFPHETSGLIHISQLAWGLVNHPKDMLKLGQDISVKIIELDYRRLRINLSIKQLEEDPLLQTLDTLIPAMVTDEEAGSNADATITEDDLKDSMKELIAMLKEVEGVDDVRLGRTAEEKRVVSQELELWISRVPMAEDSTGYNLVARSGKDVQEFHVHTHMDADAFKGMIQGVSSTLLRQNK